MVITDAFQSVLMIAGAVTLTVIACTKIGSIEHLIESVPPKYWRLIRPAGDAHFPWHAMFLGYPVHDWNLRVFLKRIWEGSLGARSWAIEPAPDALEKSLWTQANVELYPADPGDYVGLLVERLRQRTPQSARP